MPGSGTPGGPFGSPHAVSQNTPCILLQDASKINITIDRIVFSGKAPSARVQKIATPFPAFVPRVTVRQSYYELFLDIFSSYTPNLIDIKVSPI